MLALLLLVLSVIRCSGATEWVKADLRIEMSSLRSSSPDKAGTDKAIDGDWDTYAQTGVEDHPWLKGWLSKAESVGRVEHPTNILGAGKALPPTKDWHVADVELYNGDSLVKKCPHAKVDTGSTSDMKSDCGGAVGDNLKLIPRTWGIQVWMKTYEFSVMVDNEEDCKDKMMQKNDVTGACECPVDYYYIELGGYCERCSLDPAASQGESQYASSILKVSLAGSTSYNDCNCPANTYYPLSGTNNDCKHCPGGTVSEVGAFGSDDCKATCSNIWGDNVEPARDILHGERYYVTCTQREGNFYMLCDQGDLTPMPSCLEESEELTLFNVKQEPPFNAPGLWKASYAIDGDNTTHSQTTGYDDEHSLSVMFTLSEVDQVILMAETDRDYENVTVTLYNGAVPSGTCNTWLGTWNGTSITLPCKRVDYKLADKVLLMNKKADYRGEYLKVYEIVVMGVPVRMYQLDTVHLLNANSAKHGNTWSDNPSRAIDGIGVTGSKSTPASFGKHWLSFELDVSRAPVNVTLITLQARTAYYEDVHVTLYKDDVALRECETYAWDESTCDYSNCNKQNVTLVCDGGLANMVNITMDSGEGKFVDRTQEQGRTNLQVFDVEVRGEFLENCREMMERNVNTAECECPADYYSNRGSGGDLCLKCSPDMVSLAGSISWSDCVCPANYYWKYSSESCVACEEGKVSNIGSDDPGDCVCPANTYFSGDAGDCVTCGLGMISETGSDDLSDCRVGKECPSLYMERNIYMERNPNTRVCECPADTYYDTMYNYCARCTEWKSNYYYNKTASLAGSTSWSDCVCPANYYWYGQEEKCEACEEGKVSNIGSEDPGDCVYNAQVSGVENEYNTAPVVTTPEPLPTEIPFIEIDHDDQQLQEIIENKAPEFTEEKKTWEPVFKVPIPVKVVNDKKKEDNPQKSVLGYLAYTGYIDFTLDRETVDNNAKATEVTKNTVEDSIKTFQRFNGFPETGAITEPMFEYMKKPRCGTTDIKFKKENALCNDVEISKYVSEGTPEKVVMEGVVGCGGTLKQTCLSTPDLPEAEYDAFVVDDSYYFEFDVIRGDTHHYTDHVIAVFNYDKVKDTGDFLFTAFAIKNGWLRLDIGMYADTQQVNSQVVWAKVDQEKISDDIFKTDFKMRINVDKDGTFYVYLANILVKSYQYKEPIKSSALVYTLDFFSWFKTYNDIAVSTLRICKRPPPLARTDRKKRSTSMHRWAGEEILYSFVNYSSHAGENLTRKIVTTAITQYSQTIKLAFKEVKKDVNADITFMFIKAFHADHSTFYGSGKEKAHAYSPVHGEIHFNDYESFTETGAEGTTSLLYTALHELGHALGLRHSSLNEAVMHASYNPKNIEFTRDDKLNLFVHYEEGAGSISDDPNVSSNDVSKYWKYVPKLPLPRECHSQIDAGLTYEGAFYLISNLFIWKYTHTGQYNLQPGYPRRVNKVFPSWKTETFAAFEASGLVYLLSNNSVTSYLRVKGDLFKLKGSWGYVTMFNPKGKYQAIPPVLAAFTEDKTTTLVINTNLYYQITWAGKKVASLDRFDDPAGTALIGKTFQQHEFNAGIAYARKNKQGVLFNEAWQFGQRIAKSGAVFPEGEPKSPGWGVISEMFSIEGWCERKNG